MDVRLVWSSLFEQPGRAELQTHATDSRLLDLEDGGRVKKKYTSSLPGWRKSREISVCTYVEALQEVCIRSHARSLAGRVCPNEALASLTPTPVRSFVPPQINETELELPVRRPLAGRPAGRPRSRRLICLAPGQNIRVATCLR